MGYCYSYFVDFAGLRHGAIPNPYPPNVSGYGYICGRGVAEGYRNSKLMYTNPYNK